MHSRVSRAVYAARALGCKVLTCGLCGHADITDDVLVETTVFELAGEDCAGLLADVTHLLTTNGCNVRSAAVRPAPTCIPALSVGDCRGCWACAVALQVT